MTKTRLAIVAFIVMVTATACTIKQGEQYRVDLSISGAYMHINEDYSNLIGHVLWPQACHWQIVCTGDYLHDKVQVSGWGAAEWHTATHYYGDLLNNLIIVDSQNRCLVLHKDPWGGLNWQTASCGGGIGGGGGGSW